MPTTGKTGKGVPVTAASRYQVLPTGTRGTRSGMAHLTSPQAASQLRPVFPGSEETHLGGCGAYLELVILLYARLCIVSPDA